MPKIRINASEAGVRKNVSSAQEEFLRHCRLRNLSPHITLIIYEKVLGFNLLLVPVMWVLLVLISKVVGVRGKDVRLSGRM